MNLGIILEEIPSNYNVMGRVLAIVNVLSLVGCFSNLLMTLWIKNRSDTLIKIIVAICVTDLLFSLFSLLLFLVPMAESYCMPMIFFDNYGFLGSLTWTCCFAHHFAKVVRHLTRNSTEWSFRTYAIISFTLPLLLSIGLAKFQTYDIDPKTQTCWITLGDATFDWVDALFFDLPILLAVLYCTFCYLSIIIKARRSGEGTFLGLALYPLILIICVAPLVVLDVYTIFFKPEKINFYWMLITAGLWKSQGLFNAFAYGLSGGIMDGCSKAHARSSSEVSKDSRTSSTPLLHSGYDVNRTRVSMGDHYRDERKISDSAMRDILP